MWYDNGPGHSPCYGLWEKALKIKSEQWTLNNTKHVLKVDFTIFHLKLFMFWELSNRLANELEVFGKWSTVDKISLERWFVIVNYSNSQQHSGFLNSKFWIDLSFCCVANNFDNNADTQVQR